MEEKKIYWDTEEYEEVEREIEEPEPPELREIADTWIEGAAKLIPEIKHWLSAMEKWDERTLPLSSTYGRRISAGDKFIYILQHMKESLNEEIDKSIEKVARLIYTKEYWKSGVAEKKLGELGLTPKIMKGQLTIDFEGE